MDLYQEFIHKSRYARFLEEYSRRETWHETVTRYLDYWKDKFPKAVDKGVYEFLYEMIFGLEDMPSMRAMMTAGPALDRDNCAGFNCAHIAVDSLRAFDETMYLLMCGVGVGFSVERNNVRKLPEIADEFYTSDTTIVVHDSRIGWAKAFRQLIASLVNGDIPRWDTSQIRPAGTPLKTFGGRASGPAPLESLFEFTVKLFRDAAGRSLNTLEAHDLMCKIAEIVVVGGVRRSALISLSNLSDLRLRDCKKDLWVQMPDGSWSCRAPHRALSNNSVAYTEKPDPITFLKEWTSLVESQNGERGIFNRVAAKKHAARYGNRDVTHDFGGNPCLEIVLRSQQFCNLSEIVVRESDVIGGARIREKAKAAAIFGTLQASSTNFRYIRKKWKQNSEEEALLGVSLTGLMDNTWFNTPSEAMAQELQELKQLVADTNKEWAKKLGINPATSITCVKPSGTVSQLVDSSSGVHSRHSQFYIRRVRQDIKDPLNQVLKDAGVPWEPELNKEKETVVFSFPKKSPEGAILRDQRSAIEQLEYWLFIKTHWATHTVSNTVYVRPEEWVEVGAWVYKNFDEITGLSFLPYDGGKYPQAPYEELTQEAYEKMLAEMPTSIDWLSLVEGEDSTPGSRELACVGGICEI